LRGGNKHLRQGDAARHDSTSTEGDDFEDYAHAYIDDEINGPVATETIQFVQELDSDEFYNEYSGLFSDRSDGSNDN